MVSYFFSPIYIACNTNVKSEYGSQATIAVEFVQPPNSNQRPSYYSEGSRGPMKGADAKSVELKVDFDLQVGSLTLPP